MSCALFPNSTWRGGAPHATIARLHQEIWSQREMNINYTCELGDSLKSDYLFSKGVRTGDPPNALEQWLATCAWEHSKILRLPAGLQGKMSRSVGGHVQDQGDRVDLWRG